MLNAAGQVVDTLDLGAQAQRHAQLRLAAPARDTTATGYASASPPPAARPRVAGHRADARPGRRRQHRRQRADARTAHSPAPVRLQRPSRPSTDRLAPLTHQGTHHELPARSFRPERHRARTSRSSATTSPTPTPIGAKASRAEFADMYAAALNGARHQQHRHRRQPGGGGAAVHAGQHHHHREPDGPGDQRRRLLPGQRRTQPGHLHAQRPVQGRPRRLHRQQQPAAADGLSGRRATA